MGVWAKGRTVLISAEGIRCLWRRLHVTIVLALLFLGGSTFASLNVDRASKAAT